MAQKGADKRVTPGGPRRAPDTSRLGDSVLLPLKNFAWMEKPPGDKPKHFSTNTRDSYNFADSWTHLQRPIYPPIGPYR